MSAIRFPARLPAKAALAAAITVIVLATAAAAGLASPAAAPGPLVFVETLSARISGAILALGTQLPFGYAIIAGMIAAVNPCGFALLPAYLGLYLGDGRGASLPGRLASRAVAISVTMTASFVLLFGAAGILAGLAATALTSALPWIGTAVGAGLILLGGTIAAGREAGSSLGLRAASRLRRPALTGGISGYAAYGAAYGLASLGCTLPVFLGVVATSFQLHGVANATGQFMLFGLGMGIVLASVTLATAFLGQGLTRRVRSFARHAGWATATLLWLAGAYVLYYWLTAIRLL